ncbi:MAG: putative anti-sigma regulatory factor, serine/threonine protein kinase, partial [Solirubrobacterales bacterium]|nr:putative anti-sigma regulatory factor, serine/threonine protein kinase [Solirubrobacterales bacterium]
ENVTVVRHAIAGLAERIGMDETAIADLKTVVTEACMNVVVHAYPTESPGLLEVEATPEPEGLTVVVRDFGTGIRPRPDVDRPSLRIGLTLIAALSKSFEIKGGIDRGTEIRMHLALQAQEESSGEDRVPADAPAPAEETELRVGHPDLVGPILSRALGALAARREVTVDRLSDAMLLSDAISAGAPQGFEDGQVSLSIADREDGIELRVGPMLGGAAERLRVSLDLPELGGSLAALADEVRVEDGEDGEFLVVGIAALAA